MKSLFYTLLTLAAFTSCLIWLAFAWDIAMKIMIKDWPPVIEATTHVYNPSWLHVIICIFISFVSLIVGAITYSTTSKSED